jgi:hypothetical protein
MRSYSLTPLPSAPLEIFQDEVMISRDLKAYSGLWCLTGASQALQIPIQQWLMVSNWRNTGSPDTQRLTVAYGV